MCTGRLLIILIATTALSISVGCGHGSSTSPSGGGGGGGAASATFVVDDAVRFAGAHPAPIVVNGVTYVYQNSGAGVGIVQASSDGINFAPTPASFPAGVSRTIVRLADGRFRMYYFGDATSTDVVSAISSNGLAWTVEAGVRYSDPNIGAIRATALPAGGYRLYYPNGTGLSSLISTDGLAFTSEGPVTITPTDAAASWGVSAAASVNGQFHMVLTKNPASGISELWHAVSADGRNWSVDRAVLAANPGVPLNQPAWGINGSTLRIYFRAQPPGGGNAIASGIIRF